MLQNAAKCSKMQQNAEICVITFFACCTFDAHKNQIMPVRYLNGLGLVAAGKRNISAGLEFDKYFSKPLLADPFLSYAGTTTDTIKFMADIIKNTTEQTAQIARVLNTGNREKTLKKIFDFIFTHIQYQPDAPHEEQLRSPNRSWTDRKNGVDCDCYSIFIGSILSNLKIPFVLRMVKIGGKSHFQHVYVVVPKTTYKTNLSRADYWAIDPVLDTFNEEHPFTDNYDLFMQPVRYLNGNTLAGLQGNPLNFKKYYYSPEAIAGVKKGYTLFGITTYIDGINEQVTIYESANLEGLGDVGLGFIQKIWGGIKKVGSMLKNSKALKAIAYKKDENGERTVKRKIFNLRNKPQEREPNMEQMQPIQAQVSANPNTPVSNNINDTINNGMGFDQIMNTVKTITNPDMQQRLMDAELKANKGLTTEEARTIAQDTAKAQRSDIVNDVLNQLDRVKTAGFMTPQNMMMGALALGFVYMALKNQRQPAY